MVSSKIFYMQYTFIIRMSNEIIDIYLRKIIYENSFLGIFAKMLIEMAKYPMGTFWVFGNVNVILFLSWGLGVATSQMKTFPHDILKLEKKDFQIGTSKVKLPNWLLTRHSVKFLVFNLILHVTSFLRATFINFNLDPCMLSIQYFWTWFSYT